MCEALRYIHHPREPQGDLIEVDPRILEYHPCREIWNMNDVIAKRLWQQHLDGHKPIRVLGSVIIDGSWRVQAAIFLGMSTIWVREQ